MHKLEVMKQYPVTGFCQLTIQISQLSYWYNNFCFPKNRYYKMYAIVRLLKNLLCFFDHAGYGGLSIVIEGPHRSEIECKHYENRKYAISYSPHEPGIYILNLRFADDHLPGINKITINTQQKQ